MNRHLCNWIRALCLLVLMLAPMAACLPYEVIKQSGPPSALVQTRAMAVQWDFSKIQIGGDRMTEQQWLDSREEDKDRATYEETKQKAVAGFVRGLARKLGDYQISEGAASGGAIQVTVTPEFWEEGAYVGVAAWPSQINARVQFTKDGTVVDEILVKVQEAASMMTPSPQQRFNTCGERLGEYTALFVQKSTE
jgi:hypothetical protein